MHADTELIIYLMFDNKRQYQIPVYQRNYDWMKDNCLELFNDAFNAYEKSHIHFLGTIVQVQKDEESGLKHYIIVDGQQRMTSIYLLLKALYDNTSDSSTREEIKGLLFNESKSHDFDTQEKNKLKLKPIKSDNEQFLLLMNDQIKEMNKSSNIYINYEYFCELIKDKLADEYSTKNILTGLKKMQIVMISLKEPDDDPQVIFERINSTGEDLKLADLIRNYLLMTDENMDKLFEEYWLPIETELGKETLNDYFITYIGFKLGEVKKDDAYQMFKKWAEDNEYTHEQLLQDLKYYSKFYATFIGLNNNYSKLINNYLSVYRILKQSTIYPFLFSVFDDLEKNKIDEEILVKILHFFINYTIRRIVVGIPSNSLRGLYRSLYRRIFKDPTYRESTYIDSIYVFMAKELAFTQDAFPNDFIFKEKLMSENLYKNKPCCKYILSILENDISNMKEIVNIDSDITIEHILPQNKNSIEWKEMIGSDYDAVYEKYLNTLGNLSLTGYNSELSDKKFLEKVEMIKEKSKFICLNSDVIDKSKWNAEYIQQRAERLSDKLISELKLPDIFYEKIFTKNTSSYKVDDNVDFSNKKITSFILLGEKYYVSTYKEMLIKVIHELYKSDSSHVKRMAENNFKSSNAKNPLLTLDSSKLRSPKEISNTGIYVETNKSSNEIVHTISYILDEFNLNNDSLIINC